MSPRFPRWHTGEVCLLVNTVQGSALVDTGLGLHNHLALSRLVKFSIADFGIHDAPEETTIQRVHSLGEKPENIKDIVLTHMHFDHAGG
jgi:glyoxylase-like metal-dependent hydrolase (beta-lactamase superfamily II)